MEMVGSLAQYQGLIKKAKQEPSVSNCFLLPATATRLIAAGRLYYEVLSQGIAFYIDEGRFFRLQLMLKENASLALPEKDITVIGNLPYQGVAINGSARCLADLLAAAGFSFYRSSRKLKLCLDHGEYESLLPDGLRLSSPAETEFSEIIDLWQGALGKGKYEIPLPSALIAKDILCLYIEDRLAAAAVCRITGGHGELEQIAVKQGLRHRGYGEILLRGCLSKLKEAGVGHCFLWVEDGNEVACNLYQKYGFQDTMKRSVQMIKEK